MSRHQSLQKVGLTRSVEVPGTTTRVLDLAAAKGLEVSRWDTVGFGEVGLYRSRSGRHVAVVPRGDNSAAVYFTLGPC